MKENIQIRSDNGEMKQFCSFRVNERLFGINILDVKEVTSELDFTPVFHAPKEVKGYVNIRGQIHLVIDLRMLLDFPPKKVDADSCVVLLKEVVGESFGLLVDKIGDVVEVNDDLIEYHSEKENSQTEELGAYASELAEGVCKLEGELMVIINTQNVLKIIEKEAAV